MGQRVARTHLTFDEELHEQMHESRVLTALLRRAQRLFGFVKELLVEKLARRLSHLPVRMVDEFVDVLAVFVFQDAFVESTRTSTQSSLGCTHSSLLENGSEQFDRLHGHFVLAVDCHLHNAVLERVKLSCKKVRCD